MPRPFCLTQYQGFASLFRGSNIIGRQLKRRELKRCIFTRDGCFAIKDIVTGAGKETTTSLALYIGAGSRTERAPHRPHDQKNVKKKNMPRVKEQILREVSKPAWGSWVRILDGPTEAKFQILRPRQNVQK